MPLRKIPFSGVGYSYDENAIKVVMDAMRSADTLTQGKYQEEFQTKFSSYINMKYSFATSSAATAIELAAILFQIEPGDEVIIPAHTYAASAYPFARNGAKIVWADIDKDEFLVTLNNIKNLVTSKTKAVVLVHLYGLPVDAKEIVDFCRNKGIYVLEDCAQAIGASLNGEPVGAFGDISVFSFQSHKNISTLGEGGMLCFSNDHWAEVVPGLRHNGHKPFNNSSGMYWSPAMSNVDFDLPEVWPHNFCLGEIQCALGSFLLTKVDEINAKRRERFFLAQEVFQTTPKIKLQKIPNHKISAHHLLPFQFISKNYKDGADKVFKKLVADYGVYPAKQYYPLYRYGLFSKSGNGMADVPVTDNYYDNMVSLPFHHWMPEKDFEYMLDSVVRVAEVVE
jgi:dTDP-4-amino-4,6-dideoxygalactose transaminase